MQEKQTATKTKRVVKEPSKQILHSNLNLGPRKTFFKHKYFSKLLEEYIHQLENQFSFIQIYLVLHLHLRVIQILLNQMTHN